MGFSIQNGIDVAWMARAGGFSASGPAWKRIVRYIVGLTGVIVFWFGLGEIFPRGEAFIPFVLCFLRYALVGAWISGGAPALFFRFKLAGNDNR